MESPWDEGLTQRTAAQYTMAAAEPTLDHLSRGDHVVSALHLIARMLARRKGEGHVLEEVLGVMERELGFRRTTVMLASLDGAELIVEAALGAQDPTRARYRRGEGISGEVLARGRPLTVPRVSHEPRFRNRLHLRPPGADRDVGFICVPVVVDKETIGTLSVDIPRSPGQRPPCLESTTRIVGIVSSMIAADVAARRSVRLLREAQRSAVGAGESEIRPQNMVGSSSAMQAIYRQIRQVSTSDTTVLIRGESGTGKELVASAIHYASPRREGPLVKVNCAALSEGLLESELFGHERGAFTGAAYTRIGRIEQANGGTLFLDEIGDFSPATQVKLLRVLQEREYQRVGSNDVRRADVRILTATNRNLEQAVREGPFRQDLYYRINVFALNLPPLRERRPDVLELANHFVEKHAARMHKEIRRISTPAINMLLAYHWPGNVRELENCIERAVLLSNDGVIHGHNLPPTLQMPDGSESTATGSLTQQVQLLEREMIVDALKRTRGNVTAAARELGVTARMVRYKVQKLGIDSDRLVNESATGSPPMFSAASAPG
jgi:Nif-specific regulatory protein